MFYTLPYVSPFCAITLYYTNTKKAKPTVTVGFACIFYGMN